MNKIYHITRQPQHISAQKIGHYEPIDFADEGFIHCSFLHQIEPVANRLFQGQTDLVILEIDPQQLDCDVVTENLEGGSEKFPHIYGSLPYHAVLAIHLFPNSADGGFNLPESINAM